MENLNGNLCLGSKNNFATICVAHPGGFGLSLHIAYGKLRKLPGFISSSTCESVLIWVVLGVFKKDYMCQSLLLKIKNFLKERHKLSFPEHIWNIVFSSGFHILERT